jgi:hypothetical protein
MVADHATLVITPSRAQLSFASRPLRVISGNAQKVQMISGLPRQADMMVQDWQVR